MLEKSEEDSMQEGSEQALTDDDIAIADYMIDRGIDSPSELSSEELEGWIRALQPCERCQLRTPFRCKGCKAIVCLNPHCRDKHNQQCTSTWKHWLVEAYGRVKKWVQKL